MDNTDQLSSGDRVFDGFHPCYSGSQAISLWVEFKLWTDHFRNSNREYRAPVVSDEAVSQEEE